MKQIAKALLGALLWRGFRLPAAVAGRARLGLLGGLPA